MFQLIKTTWTSLAFVANFWVYRKPPPKRPVYIVLTQTLSFTLSSYRAFITRMGVGKGRHLGEQVLTVRGLTKAPTEGTSVLCNCTSGPPNLEEFDHYPRKAEDHDAHSGRDMLSSRQNCPWRVVAYASPKYVTLQELRAAEKKPGEEMLSAPSPFPYLTKSTA